MYYVLSFVLQHHCQCEKHQRIFENFCQQKGKSYYENAKNRNFHIFLNFQKDPQSSKLFTFGYKFYRVSKLYIVERFEFLQ